jgi:hypothetical protein
VDEDIYEAIPTDTGMTIQQKGGGATMTLTALDGEAQALRRRPLRRRSETTTGRRTSTAPVRVAARRLPGCSAVFSEGDSTRSSTGSRWRTTR